MSTISEVVLNGQDKVNLIRGYLERYGLRTMIETGLWNGRGAGMQCPIQLDAYIAIDWQDCNVLAARDAGYDAYTGDSARTLPILLRHALALKGPALFWLDAHGVGDEADEGSPPNPLLAELAAIVAWEHGPASVVLVDDVRMMGDRDWPTLDTIYELVGGKWETHLADDVLRLTPL